MVKMLTVLVSTISNSQVFLLKNVGSFCKCKSYSHFYSKNFSIHVYAIFNDQRFKDTLTTNIISFEQLDPVGVASEPSLHGLPWPVCPYTYVYMIMVTSNCPFQLA